MFFDGPRAMGTGADFILDMGVRGSKGNMRAGIFKAMQGAHDPPQFYVPGAPSPPPGRAGAGYRSLSLFSLEAEAATARKAWDPPASSKTPLQEATLYSPHARRVE